MVLSLRAFQQQNGHTGSNSRGVTSGHITVDDTELANRGTKSSTPAPAGVFKVPYFNKVGRRGTKGDHTRSSENALDGVVVSVDRLEKSDGALMMGSDASGRRNKNMVDDVDPEKGLIGKTPSLYSHEDRVSLEAFVLERSRQGKS